jgi:tetratricopeptide (TPR) repeat protein
MRFRNKLFRFTIYTVILAGTFACQKSITPAKFKGEKTSSFDSVAFDYIFMEAIKQKLLGNGGDALQMLEQCEKINPASDAVYFQMAQILMGAGDLKNGKKYALKAFAIDPNNFWYTMMLAGTYYNEHNLDSAILFYEKTVYQFPEKEDLALNLGNLYAENRSYEKALNLFQSLDKKYGINEKSTLSTVKIFVAEGKFNEAEKKLQELIDKFPGEINYEGLMAEIYSSKGDDKKATDLYRRLMEKDPGNRDTQLSLANFFLKTKNYDQLVSLLSKIVINESIERGEKVTLFGQLLENKEFIGKKGNELQLSSMVLEAMYRNDDIINIIRPEIMYARNLKQDAAKRLEDIIFDKADNYYAWEKLLFIYLELKDYRKLEEKGALCAARFNKSFIAKLLYATAATENKNYPVALEQLKNAEELAGNDRELKVQVLSLKSDLFYRMKEYDNSFRAFDEALKYSKDDATLLNNYAYYLAEQNLRLRDAEMMARKVIDKEKDNATYMDTYAWVLYKRGKTKDALRIMNSIMSSASVSDAEYYEHLGYILKKKKDYGNAVKNWNIALKLDPTKTNLINEIESCQETH